MLLPLIFRSALQPKAGSFLPACRPSRQNLSTAQAGIRVATFLLPVRAKTGGLKLHSAESGLSGNIAAETERAVSAEQANAKAVQAEATRRAISAEQANANAVQAESTRRAVSAEQANANAVQAESTRAQNTEGDLASQISAEASRARTA